MKTVEDYKYYIFQEFCREKFLQWFMQGIALVKARPGGLAPEDIKDEICEAQFREVFDKSEAAMCRTFWDFLPTKAEDMHKKFGNSDAVKASADTVSEPAAGPADKSADKPCSSADK